MGKGMKKNKIKSCLSLESIKIMHQSAVLHADLNNDFGLFSLGVAICLRSIFEEFQGNSPDTLFDINLVKATAGTITLLDGFDGATRDLRTAEVWERTNEKLSGKILGAAREARKKRDEKL
jgi:hypothetical protein